MPTNFYMYFVTALIPLVVGAVYYHPKVVGTAWMRVNNFQEKDLEGANMAVIFGLSYFLSLIMCVILTILVIHQGGISASLMNPDVPGAWTVEDAKTVNALMAEYGSRFRSFGHGAIHGLLAAILFALPIIAINAMFERRGGKYILIHWGYWAISLILMGGILCATLQFPEVVGQ